MISSTLWLPLTLYVVLIIKVSAPSAVADELTGPALAQGRAEFQGAVEALRPRATFDTTLVNFSVGGIQYRIPRNYLIRMGYWNGGPQPLVTVRVNIPDLRPLSQDTVSCFTTKPTLRPPGCHPFSFDIEATGIVTADEGFANMRALFRSQTPLEGPSGYEKYEIGAEEHRIEYYRKVVDGRTLLYSCQIFDNHGKQDGLCTPNGDRMSNGGTLHFFFSLGCLSEIAGIDASLRKLTEGFTVQSGGEK